MIPFKLKYIEIPPNNLKPLDYFFARAIPGETFYFETAKQVEDLVRTKLQEGWHYLTKIEEEVGFILYFTREKK